MAGNSSKTKQKEVPKTSEEVARLNGEPVYQLPSSLYIPPEVLVVFLEKFEGPLDFLLFLIRRQKFDILDIPVAELTDQYLYYVEQIRKTDLEQVGEYLLMAAYLIEIKSRTLLPAEKNDKGEEIDPRAEIVRQLVERDRLQKSAMLLDNMPQAGRDFEIGRAVLREEAELPQPKVSPQMILSAWETVLKNLKTKSTHKISREELSEREFMTEVLRRLSGVPYLRFTDLFTDASTVQECVVYFIAILELQKEGLLNITQAAPFAPIFLEPISKGT